MQQFRIREGSGSDRRWFNPERDIVYLWPRVIRQSLLAFSDFEGMPGCSQEQLQETGGRLAKALAGALKGQEGCAVMSDELKKIEAECPVCFSEISRVALHTLGGMYAAWLGDARPVAEEDAKLPVLGLEEIIAALAKGARGPAKSGV